MTKKRVGRETNSTWWFHLMVARRVIRPLVKERNTGELSRLVKGWKAMFFGLDGRKEEGENRWAIPTPEREKGVREKKAVGQAQKENEGWTKSNGVEIRGFFFILLLEGLNTL